MTASNPFSEIERDWLNKASSAEKFYSKAFPRKFVLELSRGLDVTDIGIVERLWQTLGMAGRQFEELRAGKATSLRPSEIRTDLEKIKQTATKLLDQIGSDETPPSLRHLLWRAEIGLSRNVLDEACSLREIGAVIALPAAEDGARQCLSPGLVLVRPQIQYLLKLIEAADELVEPGSTGRRRDYALDFFIERITRFWSLELGREVTVDPNQPQNYTDIERFAECCVNRLDPNSTAKIKTYLRHHRTDENRSEK
ncbi:hypothetical protein [Maricaulis sp.]|uniref:hypothetical protein n=1 Tax=Maricaulis sp. TaxID=1486257 RepID=UPI003A900913